MEGGGETLQLQAKPGQTCHEDLTVNIAISLTVASYNNALNAAGGY